MGNNSDNQYNHQLGEDFFGKSKKSIPPELLACAKLPRSKKMAIFEDRKHKVLKFLVAENYSGIKNLASLIETSRQTAMRIMKCLCDDQYVVKFEANHGHTHNISIYQITNTGIMFILDEVISSLPKLYVIDNLCIRRDFSLQAIRISLQKRGYSKFQKINQILQTKHELCGKKYKVPEYLCADVDANTVAIEYEEVIQDTDIYSQIICQYINAIQDGLINKVLFYTRPGLASKLNNLFLTIGNSIFKNNPNSFDLSKAFYFLEEF